MTISGPSGSPEPYSYARAVSELIDHLSNITPLNNDPHSWAAGAQFLQDLWVAGKPGAVAAPAATPTTPPPPTPRHEQTYISGNQGLAVLCAESPNPRHSDLYPKIAEFAVHRSGPVGEYWTWAAESLTIDVYGHTALLNRSSCANHHEIEYLLHGTLPPPDARCPQNTTPFTK